MTALQTKNMPNPVSGLNNYKNVYIVDDIQMENILIPAKPLKQKRYVAWNKTVNEISNNTEFHYLYGKIEIDRMLQEVAGWTLNRIKNYIGLYLFIIQSIKSLLLCMVSSDTPKYSSHSSLSKP